MCSDFLLRLLEGDREALDYKNAVVERLTPKGAGINPARAPDQNPQYELSKSASSNEAPDDVVTRLDNPISIRDNTTSENRSLSPMVVSISNPANGLPSEFDGYFFAVG
jgi:hypothetical protein